MAKSKKMNARTPQQTEDEEMGELMAEFGELVEESLIIMFLREQGFEEAHKTLAGISENVRNEEASGFDPSGLQGSESDPNGDGSEESSYLAPAGASSSFTITSDGESGSQNTPLSAGRLEDWRAVANDLPADGSTTIAALQSVFSTLKESDIRRALKESGDDIDKASDILLNLEHLEQTGQRMKGIDAFFRPDDAPARRGKKKKGPISPKHGRAALSLDYKLAPLNLDVEDVGGERSQARSAPPLRASDLSGRMATSRASHGEALAEREETARQSRQASNISFAAASAAARRGRSDPLFRQVAVVYSERGRELAQQARLAESDAADARVDEQSSPDKIDIHFVPVHDGVRIALERTNRWWASLGEDRIKQARENPLQVVTGIGLHSARGYSRMYGEVGNALERGGWKVLPGPGHYFVTGRRQL